MDHSHMDHSHMDHSHMDHSQMHHGGTEGGCTMNMLWNLNPTNICIITDKWRITDSFTSLLLSLLAITLIAAGLELFKARVAAYENWAKKQMEAQPKARRSAIQARVDVIRAVSYGVQVFYGYMAMLISMTYNAWVLVALSVGHAVGYWTWRLEQSAVMEGTCCE
ncbi:Ctr copper transporter family-domain-containing protein [Pseudomassariella vexata]|uniref:Copper transport protein n=1 Tax=Pseudomassariella vexata TaxID=1141098 RepID=A0A1Y2DQ59_9PEZI|nr:Ctr copper transporter family-domain-containing protein [Pseudomassariella vexata]ORY61390.1 Ctr copper transporter family-domain-containing protein [Pseudomassariella vexata]